VPYSLRWLSPLHAQVRTIRNLELAFEAALINFGVPRLLDADDLVAISCPEEKSIMTYALRPRRRMQLPCGNDCGGLRRWLLIRSFEASTRGTHGVLVGYSQGTRALVCSGVRRQVPGHSPSRCKARRGANAHAFVPEQATAHACALGDAEPNGVTLMHHAAPHRDGCI
jgi:hypothetical protein